MKIADIPTRVPLPFAKNAGGPYKRSIPVTTGDAFAASLDQGFPAGVFAPVGAGGKGPAGKDFNGILNLISAWSWWQSAGAPSLYDATFATAVGGYPKGTKLLSTDGLTLWQSLVDDNTVNPDAGPSTNWLNTRDISLSGIDVTVNSNGLCLEIAGYYFQMGKAGPFTPNSITGTVTFPKPYVSAVPMMPICGASVATALGGSASAVTGVQEDSLTRTGFVSYVKDNTGTPPTSVTWFTIGAK